ncbi:hypothetical protein EDB89DRAFT_1905711 [Lactarius sanguifluus]|nr:hypothetical protein EDB89DRAFT_1905711 [Lactarius sanguifluus]
MHPPSARMGGVRLGVACPLSHAYRTVWSNGKGDGQGGNGEGQHALVCPFSVRGDTAKGEGEGLGRRERWRRVLVRTPSVRIEREGLGRGRGWWRMTSCTPLLCEWAARTGGMGGTGGDGRRGGSQCGVRGRGGRLAHLCAVSVLEWGGGQCGEEVTYPSAPLSACERGDV